MTSPFSGGFSAGFEGLEGANLIHAVGHGLLAGDAIMLGNLVGGEGLEENTVYYVSTDNLGVDDFHVTDDSTGAGIREFTTDITQGVILRPSEYLDAELEAARSRIANDVEDGIVTTDKIGPSAVTAAKIYPNTITADKLATTLLLASLIQTAESGRRIEIDVDGVRLYDTDETPLVDIPTDPAKPVYVKGQVNASSLISNDSAEFRIAASLAGDAVMTLQNGISEPTAVPTLTPSVDSLALTSTPSSLGHGIAYDSAAGTFLLACDPAGGYVAQEFNKTTGALVRSIAATGSTTQELGTAGGTGHVTDTTDALATTTNTHIAAVIDMPTGRDNMQITKVSVWCSGYLGSVDLTNGVWNTSGSSLGQSAEYTAASRTFSNGNDSQHNRTLTSPASVSSGQTIWAGFRRTSTSEGVFWSKNDGSSKVTKSADGTGASGTGWATYDSNSKPNVYVTYTYDVDTRLETSPMVGIATDGTYIYTLDELGQLWTYLRSDGSYVTHSSASSKMGGYLPNAGLFYDATNSRLVVTTADGQSGSDLLDLVRYSLSSGVATWADTLTTDLAVNGLAAMIRGGALLADALNASADEYWVPVSGTVYAFLVSTGANVVNRDFGSTTSVYDGLTHDGTVFRGWVVNTPTKVWKFSTWDWTTGGQVFWYGYAWYDSAGTAHETAVGPTTSITLKRHQRLQVQTAAIPTGGADDPDSVRIYGYQGAADAAAGSRWLQATDALTARYLTAYAAATNDGTVAVFPSGTAAILQSAGTGWSLEGDGTGDLGLLVTGGKPPVRQVYTASTTWSHPAGLSHATVEVQGGGGGGGGCATTAGAGAAAGGGGGGCSMRLYTAAQLTSGGITVGGTAATVTVGGAGTAGSSASGGNGGGGGASSFSGGAPGITTITGNGGSGGLGDGAGGTRTQHPGGAGGSASGGDLNIDGADGGGSSVRASDYYNIGNGGSSHLGGGGRSGVASNGVAGGAYGGGGGGGATTSAAVAGGAGAAGVVIVTEHYVG